jgi:cytochrome b6-f complex iron-sulfur subunit
MLGCGKNESAVTNNQPVNFTINLATQLLLLNDMIVQQNVRVIRIANGNLPASFIALDQYCTHAAGNLNWVAAQNKFVCPVHGSEFNSNGNVIANSGPASKDLKKFAITINGNTLTING